MLAALKVQFRIDGTLLEYLQGRGLNPNEVARRAFEREVRRLRAQDAQDRLRRLHVTFTGDAAAIVREEREGH